MSVISLIEQTTIPANDELIQIALPKMVLDVAKDVAEVNEKTVSEVVFSLFNAGLFLLEHEVMGGIPDDTIDDAQ